MDMSFGLSFELCSGIAQNGPCPLALTFVSPSMRAAVESSPGGFRHPKISSRLKRGARGALERHITVMAEDSSAFGDRTTSPVAGVIEATMWWLVRRADQSYGDIPLHVTTNAHDLAMLGAAITIVESLYVLSLRLTRLTLLYMPRLHTLELRNCTCLTSIALKEHDGWPLGPDGRPSAPAVHTLDVGETQLRSLAGVVQIFPRLHTLHIDGCTSVEDWPAAAPGLAQLRVLNATSSGLTDISWLPALARLEELQLHSCGDILDWSPVGSLSRLRILNANYGSFTSIAWITGCSELEQLFLYGCTGLTAGEPIGQLAFLQRLNMSLAPLTSVAWIDACGSLEYLSMQGATNSPCRGMGSIGRLSCLRTLNLAYSTVRHIGWLRCCTSLQELYMVGCVHVMDWSPIGPLLLDAAGLQVVDLRESNVSGMYKWPAAAVVLADWGQGEARLSARDHCAVADRRRSVRVLV